MNLQMLSLATLVLERPAVYFMQQGDKLLRSDT